MSNTYKAIKEGFNIISKTVISSYHFGQSSPNGKKSNRDLTISLAIAFEEGRFEEGEKFSGLQISRFTKDLTTVSTTEKFYGSTLLHVAINSAKPRALSFALNIARERNELETALMSTNENNLTPMENIERLIKHYSDKNTENKDPLEGLKTCKKIIQNTHQHLIYKRRWDKKTNTGKLLA